MISTSKLKAQWLEGRAREAGSMMQAVFDAIYYGPNDKSEYEWACTALLGMMDDLADGLEELAQMLQQRDERDSKWIQI